MLLICTSWPTRESKVNIKRDVGLRAESGGEWQLCVHVVEACPVTSVVEEWVKQCADRRYVKAQKKMNAWVQKKEKLSFITPHKNIFVFFIHCAFGQRHLLLDDDHTACMLDDSQCAQCMLDDSQCAHQCQCAHWLQFECQMPITPVMLTSVHMCCGPH